MIFVLDGRNCFDSVLFYGNEAKLVLFDVLLFSLVDAYVHNYLTASLITYIFCKVDSFSSINQCPFNEKVYSIFEF